MNYICFGTSRLLAFSGAYARVREDECKSDFWPGWKSWVQGPDTSWAEHDNQGYGSWRCHIPSTGCCSLVMEEISFFCDA